MTAAKSMIECLRLRIHLQMASTSGHGPPDPVFFVAYAAPHYSYSAAEKQSAHLLLNQTDFSQRLLAYSNTVLCSFIVCLSTPRSERLVLHDHTPLQDDTVNE